MSTADEQELAVYEESLWLVHVQPDQQVSLRRVGLAAGKLIPFLESYPPRPALRAVGDFLAIIQGCEPPRTPLRPLGTD